MLMPFSARARNMRPATPGCVAMPRPTMESFDTSRRRCSLRPPIPCRRPRRPGAWRADRRENRERDVAVAVVGDVLHDHVHGDVLSASFENTLSAAPGRSGTPITFTRASFFNRAAPQTARPAISGSATIIVPGLSLKLLRTWTGTENFLANSIERLCITPAPAVASSSISS